MKGKGNKMKKVIILHCLRNVISSGSSVSPFVPFFITQASIKFFEILKFEILTAVIMEISVSWCSLVGSHYLFGGTSCLHLVDRRVER
jgi:hypothetical protein